MSSKATAARQNTTAPVSNSVSTAVLQRQCACGQHSPVGEGECDQCKKNRVSLSRHAKGAGPVSIDSRVRSAIESPGQALDHETRSLMESRFHHDFSSVRVHTGARAEESTSALQANAYALGRNIVFAHGRYNPASADGLHLMAHELAHVVQQKSAPAPGPQTDLEVSAPGDSAEREAEAAADRVAGGAEASVKERADSSTVHRELSQGAKTGLEIGGGVIAGVGAIYGLYKLFQWLLEDASDIKNPPKCEDPQQKMIKPSMAKASSMVKSALENSRLSGEPESCGKCDRPETAHGPVPIGRAGNRGTSGAGGRPDWTPARFSNPGDRMPQRQVRRVLHLGFGVRSGRREQSGFLSQLL